MLRERITLKLAAYYRFDQAKENLEHLQTYIENLEKLNPTQDYRNNPHDLLRPNMDKVFKKHSDAILAFEDSEHTMEIATGKTSFSRSISCDWYINELFDELRMAPPQELPTRTKQE